MIDWDKISDEEMRDEVVKLLTEKRAGCQQQSAHDGEIAATATSEFRRGRAASAARYFSRQAAHYQQAIDLLTKAEMPERSEA